MEISRLIVISAIFSLPKKVGESSRIQGQKIRPAFNWKGLQDNTTRMSINIEVWEKFNLS